MRTRTQSPGTSNAGCPGDNLRKTTEELRENSSLHQLAEFLGLARAMVHHGTDAFLRGDQAKAAAVSAMAGRLAAQDEALEPQFLEARGPIPLLGARVKALTYLSRVGRHGHELARRAGIAGPFAARPAGLVQEQAQRVVEMMGNLEHALADGVAPNLDDLLRAGDHLEQSHLRLLDELQDQGVQLAMASYALCNCRDALYKLAEKLHWAATGERVLVR